MRASGNRVARAASIAVAWAVQLTWLDADRLDDRDVAGAVALLDAARLVDRHELVGPTVFSFTTNLHHVWDGDPPLAAVARDSTGRVAGVLNVGLPHWDNTHVGFVHVTVDPLARRQSIGRLLFESGVDRVRAEGRTLVLSDCWADSAGVEFARAMGMDQASANGPRDDQHGPGLWQPDEHEAGVPRRTTARCRCRRHAASGTARNKAGGMTLARRHRDRPVRPPMPANRGRGTILLGAAQPQ
jgi:GNAT superfamily N-acetyltransferase